MPRTRRNRLYARNQGGTRRWHGDFRDYGDVGGRREALVPKGAKSATTDAELARALAVARVAELEAKRRRGQRGEPINDAYIAAFAVEHLKRNVESKKISEEERSSRVP